jgi:hypothetical protein
MDKQELVDRLVTAVGEGDVLYTLYWLREMDKIGFGQEGLHSEREFTSSPLLFVVLLFHFLPLSYLTRRVRTLADSWKRRCALVNARTVAKERGSVWATSLMVDWTFEGREQGGSLSFFP